MDDIYVCGSLVVAAPMNEPLVYINFMGGFTAAVENRGRVKKKENKTKKLSSNVGCLISLREVRQIGRQSVLILKVAVPDVWQICRRRLLNERALSIF